MRLRPAILTVILLSTGIPVTAQEQPTAEPDAAAERAPETAAETPDTASPDAAQVAPTGPQDGERYILETHGSWSLRCLKVNEGTDPCEMHQTLTDEGGVQTAEVSVFPVNQGEAVAGATIITPLNTQLTQGITVSVDGGPEARYPFLFCNRIGCFSQFGLSAEDLSTMKRGAAATLKVASMAAPQNPVSLTISLSGFTAAYDALVARN